MRPTQKPARRTPSNLYDKVRRRESLWAAWRVINDNATKSRSASTHSEAKEFAANLVSNLERIGRQLARKRFVFAPQKGVLISKKGGKSKRPVVIAPIQARVVQRAILDVVQRIPRVKSQLTAGFNFGGVPGDQFGVPNAIAKVHRTIQQPGFFIRTDIKSFFRHVPRDRAIRCVLEHVRDRAFRELFEQAVTTEIEDAASWGADLQLFPIHDEGVAQGSCLSPLLCNLLLADFDAQMNARNVVTIRYIDDFLILASNRAIAYRAFESAIQHLRRLGLDAYDPRTGEDSDKADEGQTAQGIPFLGCEIRPRSVRPSRTKCRQLIKRLREIFDESTKALRDPKLATSRHLTTAETLDRTSKVIRGWANTMAFCTDDRLMSAVDLEITAITDKYISDSERILARLAPLDRRRARGVFAIEDRVSSRVRDEIVAATRRAILQPTRQLARRS